METPLVGCEGKRWAAMLASLDLADDMIVVWPSRLVGMLQGIEENAWSVEDYAFSLSLCVSL